MKCIVFFIGLVLALQLFSLNEAATPFQRTVGNRGASHITQFPFEVSIRKRFCDACAYEHYCSGTIYSSKVIITAASCVKDASVQRTQVVASTSKSSSSAQDGQVYLVEIFTIHENADIDIALIHLSMGLSLNGLTATPVNLATEQPKVGQKALVAGWGQVSEFEVNFDDNMKAIQVPIMDSLVCKAAYYWTSLKDTELCAGYLEGGTDTCQGDAGSPLMVDGQMVGIVSWGYGCARAGSPGVYTNIVMLRAWISQNASKGMRTILKYFM